MAQGQFTKQEARATQEAVKEMWEALPRSKKLEFLGHLNDIELFLSAAENAAPDETEKSQ